MVDVTEEKCDAVVQNRRVFKLHLELVVSCAFETAFSESPLFLILDENF